MNLSDLANPGFLLDAAQTVAVVALWLRKPGETATQVASEVKSRVALLEERLKAHATSTELVKLEGSVSAVKATVEGMSERQDMVGHTVSRIETYLLNHGNGGNNR